MGLSARRNSGETDSRREFPTRTNHADVIELLNGGCGEYDERHKLSDITIDDVAKAAEGQYMDMKQTLANMQEPLRGAAKATQRPS